MLVVAPFIFAFATFKGDNERKLYTVEAEHAQRSEQEKDILSPPLTQLINLPPSPPASARGVWRLDYASECSGLMDTCSYRDCCEELVCVETKGSPWGLIKECHMQSETSSPPPPPVLRYATKKELDEARFILGDMLSNMYKWVTDLVYQDWTASSPKVRLQSPDLRSGALTEDAYATPSNALPSPLP